MYELLMSWFINKKLNVWHLGQHDFNNFIKLCEVFRIFCFKMNYKRKYSCDIHSINIQGKSN